MKLDTKTISAAILLVSSVNAQKERNGFVSNIASKASGQFLETAKNTMQSGGSQPIGGGGNIASIAQQAEEDKVTSSPLITSVGAETWAIISGDAGPQYTIDGTSASDHLTGIAEGTDVKRMAIAEELDDCVRSIDLEDTKQVNTYLSSKGEDSLRVKFQDSINVFTEKNEDIAEDQFVAMFDLYDIYLETKMSGTERDHELLETTLSSECKIAFESTESYYRKEERNELVVDTIQGNLVEAISGNPGVDPEIASMAALEEGAEFVDISNNMDCREFMADDIGLEMCIAPAVYNSLERDAESEDGDESFVVVEGVIRNIGTTSLCNMTYFMPDVETAADYSPSYLPYIPDSFAPGEMSHFKAVYPIDEEDHVAPTVDLLDTFYKCAEQPAVREGDVVGVSETEATESDGPTGEIIENVVDGLTNGMDETTVVDTPLVEEPVVEEVVDTPVVIEEADNLAAPVVEEETPVVVEEETPVVVEEETPVVVEEETPVVEEETPVVVEEETPVVEEKTPVVEEKTPVVEEETPVVKEETPIVAIEEADNLRSPVEEETNVDVFTWSEYVTPDTMCLLDCHDAIVTEYGSEVGTCVAVSHLIQSECSSCSTAVLEATQEKCLNKGCSINECAVPIVKEETSGAYKNTYTAAIIGVAGAIALLQN